MNDLVGIGYWGDSLLLLPKIFSGINKGLKLILVLCRRKDPKKEVSYTRDSVLVGNLEELVDFSLQEITSILIS